LSKDIKKTVHQGVYDILQTLYQHASFEAKRIPKLRGTLEKVEDKVLEYLKDAPEDVALKTYPLLLQTLERRVNFLERMQKVTIQALEMTDRLKEVEEDNQKPLPLSDTNTRKIKAAVEQILDDRLARSES